MARSSMVSLILAVRRAVGDKAGGTQVFTDDEIQAALDRRKLDFPLAMLQVRATTLENGTVEYREYFADGGDWESNATLQGNRYQTLTPVESYPMEGRWVFGTTLGVGAVYIRGTRYDVYGAAADIAEQWAAQAATEFDFSRGSRSYSRSQKRTGLESLARILRNKQWVMVGEQRRFDMV